MSIATQNPPQGLMLGMEACEGRVAFRYKLDFSLGATIVVDLSQFFNQGTIKSIQSIYANNKGNANELVFDFSQTQQSITIPPAAQAYLPILQPNSPQFTVTCTNGASVAYLQVMNFFLPPAMWNQVFSTSDPIVDAIIISGRMNVRTTPQAVIDNNASGTITAGGTGQLLMAANVARLQWSLQNPSTATEILQFSKTAIGGPWYDLLPGQFAGEDGSTIFVGALYVLAATTGHAFTSDWGQ